MIWFVAPLTLLTLAVSAYREFSTRRATA
jgi:hypothetical protein